MTIMNEHRIAYFCTLFLITISILISCGLVHAETIEPETGVFLLVTDTEGIESIQNILETKGEPAYADIVNFENTAFDSNLFRKYKAIAFPYEEKLTDEIQKAWASGCEVYLYGDLTIQKYKTMVGLDRFTLEVNLHNCNGEVIQKATQYFEPEYEENERFDIISYGSIRPLLVKAESGSGLKNHADMSVWNYLECIVGHFKRMNQSQRSDTYIDCGFDIVKIWGENNQFSNHMEYFLYRNYDEELENYDFFGIKTHVWVENSVGTVTGIQTKYALPFSSDNLIDTAPASYTNIGALDVSVGWGLTDPEMTIGYTKDLSNCYPTISHSTNYGTDTVEWMMSPRSFLPLPLDGNNLICSATWASWGIHTAAVDLYYNGVVEVGSNGVHSLTPGYTKYQMRFEY